MKNRMRAITLAVGTATLLAAVAPRTAEAQRPPYPKPQVSSAEGQPAADFTLKNQDGKDFKLSAHRGQPVLLYFYRGYW